MNHTGKIFSKNQAFSCPYHTFKGLLVAYRSEQYASYVLHTDFHLGAEVPYSLMFLNMLLRQVSGRIMI